MNPQEPQNQVTREDAFNAFVAIAILAVFCTVVWFAPWHTTEDAPSPKPEPVEIQTLAPTPTPEPTHHHMVEVVSTSRDRIVLVDRLGQVWASDHDGEDWTPLRRIEGER